MRDKTCKNCKVKFTPTKPMQTVCGYKCAVMYSKTLRINAERKINRQTRESIKTKSEWLREAQIEFNKYIRLRDIDLPCISCQRFHTGQYHAGHYRTVGSAAHLRFDERNVHKQCSACNNYLSGNIVNYRINLVKKIGIEEVEKLESDNTTKHYTIEEIKAIKIKYKQLAKDLKIKHAI